MKKIGLLFGGMSNEAEISVVSAKNVVENFNYKKYRLVLIYWDKNGNFYKLENINQIKNIKNSQKININDFKKYFDIALLMTHGKWGEDGCLQAILEMEKIKYCGCRVLSSAVCMDKGLFKNLIKGEKINQVKFKEINYNTLTNNEINKIIISIKKEMKLPLFIKPANSGSSVGITKVDNYNKINFAIKEALKHDGKIIIEEGLLNPREIEVAVMGNKNLNISLPGELKPAKEFYDYEDKYKLNKTEFYIPAKLKKAELDTIKNLATKAYKICNCSGFARVDFFISKGKIYLNEINTLPGFTKISMFPVLMMKQGMSYRELLNKIIELAY